MSTSRLSKTIKDPQHIPTIIFKRGGLTMVLGVARLGYYSGGKGAKIEPKLRSLGASLLQKSARESGEVAEIEICARIIRQVKS